MSDNSPESTRNILGALFALLSVVLFLALIIALINFRTGHPGSVFLALVVCVSFSFWLLGGPAIWRETRREKAIEAAASAKANEVKAAVETTSAARREAVTVWAMPDESLFCVAEDRSLDWDYNDPDPDIDLHQSLTPGEADDLFALFASDARLNWMVGLSHCQARADLTAEIAADRGKKFEKLWAIAADLDRGTAVSGFEGKLYVDLNVARTEAMAWNFHVAPCAYTRDDPFDVNGRQFRSLKVRERNALLVSSFDLEDTQTIDALSVTLRGQYADELMTKAPDDFNLLSRHIVRRGFRHWWCEVFDFDRLEELLAADGYFGVPINTVQKTAQETSWELQAHAIRTTHWKQVAPMPINYGRNSTSHLSCHGASCFLSSATSASSRDIRSANSATLWRSDDPA